MRTNKGGSFGLEGYLYQVLVSVWVAVDVLLVNKRAERLELEPADEEDIAADLTSTGPPVVGAELTADTYTLRVQVKSSSGEAWTARRFRAVLEHGGPSRASALQRLTEEPCSRYLLITDNVVASSLQPIAVRDIGAWPTEWNGSPRSSSDGELLNSLVPRVAVLYGCSEDYVRYKLERHLETTCHVPRSRVNACFSELYEQALHRMRVAADHTWRRSDLEECIKRYDGYLAESRSDEEYVKPKNWHLLLQKLTEQYAVIIKGESGTGKTSAALALIRALRERVPGIETVLATTPSTVRDCKLRPVVFYLDDPWGKSRFEPNAEPWRSDLPGLLLLAGPACFFVTTTRSDVFQSAELDTKHSRWIVPLESSDYEPRDRFAMFRNRLSAIPAGFRPVVADRRGDILQELRSPYEIDQFFGNLAGHEPGETYHDLRVQIDDAVRCAHIEAIQGTIREQVKKRDATVAAIVLWCALAVSESSDRDFLRSIHTTLAVRERHFESIGLDELVSFLVAGKSLRQAERVVSYGHPQVREALRHFISSDVVRSQSVLRSFCAALVQAYRGASQARAAEALARLSAALPQEVDKSVVFEGDSGRLMDEWLLHEALAGHQFEDKLKLLSRAGTPKFVPAEVARFLTERGVCHPFAEEHFKPFCPDEAWLTAASEHSSTAQLCNAFLSWVLPHSLDTPQSDFADILQGIAGDTSAGCLAGLSGLVEGGARAFNARWLLAEAGKDLEGLRRLAVVALAQYQSIDFGAADSEEFIAVEDCYYGADYVPEAAYVWESVSVLDDVLQHFVAEVRRARGWRSFAADAAALGMEEWWLRAAASACVEEAVESEEVLKLWSRIDGGEHEHRFWDLASSFWVSDVGPILLDKLLAQKEDGRLRESIVMCARSVEGGAILAAAATHLGNEERWSKLLELLAEVDGREALQGEAFFEKSVDLVLAAIPWPHRRYLECVLRDSSPLDVPPADFLSCLEMLVPEQDEALLAVVRAKASRAMDPSSLVQRLLDTCKKGEAPAQAVAVSSEFLNEAELRDATSHRFGKVRAASFDALVARVGNIDAEVVLRLSKDPSLFTKQTVCDYVCREPAANKAALHQLVFDSWSDSPYASDGDGVSLPFASRAIAALGMVEHFCGDDEEVCLKAGFASRDPSVCLQAFRNVVARGTRDSRSALMTTALSAIPQRGRLEAAAALAAELHCVEQELAAQIRLEDVLEVDASVAVRLAKVVGGRTDARTAAGFAEKIGMDPERRVLLLPMGIGAKKRPRLLALIKGLLPPDTAALRVFQPSRGDIPVECLAQLGGHEEVEAVRRALRAWFVKG